MESEPADKNGTPKEAKKRDRHIPLLDRLIQQAIADDRVLGAGDDPFAKKFPELWRWMTNCDAGKNHKKQPARITIATGPGGILATLTDPDLKVSFPVEVTYLEEIWAALEAYVTSSTKPPRMVGKTDPQMRKRKVST